jgi:crotonobetainyl-CoA:carnitine CoA-transferase CaiB-like acyl-CoA transferase
MKNHLPLEGITVLELGNSVAAPFAGEILGDLGADVIKVEKRDGGDDARKWAPPYWHGTSAIFQNFNRNKRSVAVELRDPEENARLKAFILERVDVVLQNMRRDWWNNLSSTVRPSAAASRNSSTPISVRSAPAVPTRTGPATTR